MEKGPAIPVMVERVYVMVTDMRFPGAQVAVPVSRFLNAILESASPGLMETAVFSAAVLAAAGSFEMAITRTPSRAAAERAACAL